VPCDCVMVSGTGVKVKESSLTGDAYPVVKQAATQDALVASTRRVASAIGGSASRFDPFLFAGSTLQGGSCTAVAFCVGARTQLGRKLASTQRQPEVRSRL
jgi:magnesium-transporting ATPase (P-type)